jgi:hypothetical protein
VALLPAVVTGRVFQLHYSWFGGLRLFQLRNFGVEGGELIG